jgi:hypothetical protein
MNRSTIIAVTTFVLLGVAYFATREPQVSVGVHKLTLSPVNAETLSTIELGGPTPLTLSKDNGSWFVSSAGKKYVADEGSAKALADALANLKAPDFVTARAEKHAELEVDSAKGFTVKTAGRDLVLGKSSKNGGNYVRVQGSDEVYVTNGGIGLQARRPLTDWRKKSIATFKTDELVKLTLPDLSISNEGGVWKPTSELPKDFRFDVNVAQRFAGTVTNLNAQDFSEGETDEALGLAAPLLITVESKDGRKLTLRLGEKKPDGKRALRVEGDAQTYWLPSWVGEQVALSRENFRDLRVMEFDTAKAQKLTFTAAGKKTVVTKDADSWKLVEPKTAPAGVDVDLAQVPAVLNRLSMQRALKLAPAEAKLGAPAVTVDVTLEGNVTRSLVYDGQDKVKGFDGLVYVTTATERQVFEKGVEVFKRPPPPPPQRGGMQGLDQLPPEIRAQIEAQLRSGQLGQ